MAHKLVIIGAAGHHHLVFDEIDKFPQVQFAAYAPSFPGENVAALGGRGAKAYDDWRAMLDAEQPEIVTLSGRYDLNGPLALEAAQRGCAIISEKPAAHTLAEVAALRAVVEQRGLLYASMLPMRYDSPFYTAHRLVREGVIGEPYLITGQKSYRWGNSRPEWYADRNKYGSTMTWVGIHAFDFARFVAGIEYTEVFAYHANRVHTERPGCQDVATVIARLGNGGSATFNLDFLRPQAASTHGDERLRVAGSRGVLEVYDAGRKLKVITPEEEVTEWPLAPSGRTFFGDVVAALEGRGELLCPAEEAFCITEFAILAAQAADEGRVLRV